MCANRFIYWVCVGKTAKEFSDRLGCYIECAIGNQLDRAFFNVTNKSWFYRAKRRRLIVIQVGVLCNLKVYTFQAVDCCFKKKCNYTSCYKSALMRN